MEKAHDHQQPVYMCFVDFRKAFDSVSHEKLWFLMLEMGYPSHLVQILASLYKRQRAKVKVAGTLSRDFAVNKGVRQGCVLSPYLFNIMAEMVMRKVIEDFDGGFLIGGRRVSNLRYADDIVLLASSEAELQLLLDKLDNVSQEFGLLINVDKTKVMAMRGNSCTVTIQGTTLEQVSSFTYLGSVITEDGKCEKDIRTRLGKAAGVSVSLLKVWKSHDITVRTKVRLLRSLVWPVATYACESWTLKKGDEARIRAFEMKCLRKILRVSWTQKRTNEWVMEKAETERNLLESVVARKLRFFGHIVRKTADCLEKEIMEGSLPGKRARGRPRTAWQDNIKAWTGMTLEEALRATENREHWRMVVRDAAKPRIEDG